MNRKAVLDQARRLSDLHHRTMHAWAVVCRQGQLSLGLYLYKGSSLVVLEVTSVFPDDADADEAKMLVDHLNETRGLSGAGVAPFRTLYERHIRRSGIDSLVEHLHP